MRVGLLQVLVREGRSCVLTFIGALPHGRMNRGKKGCGGRKVCFVAAAAAVAIHTRAVVLDEMRAGCLKESTKKDLRRWRR